MQFRSLRFKHGDKGAEVTVPKSLLEADGVVPNDADEDAFREAIADAQTRWDRIGARTYVVRVDDGCGGDLPQIENCRPVRQLAASMTLDTAPSRAASRSD